MKAYILSTTALAFGTLASSTQLNTHGLEDLVQRDIDPKTMDPTRLSVLSVLRTAIPSGSDFPKPTGDFEPEWYQKLPEDVKSLLPKLYPATSTSTSTSATVSVPAPTSTPSGVATSVVSSMSPMSSVVVSAATAPSPWTSQLTITKTLQYALSASAGVHVSANSTSTAAVLTNGTLPIATASPSATFSGGANTAMEVETLAVFVWVGLATGFFLFA